MKKKNFLWLIAFALLLPLFALTACSDDDDDDNNDSNGDKTEQTSNNGTKVLSKKVTKIVETYSEGGKYEEVETYIFDTDGRLISRTEVENYDNHDVETELYTYNNNTIDIEETENNQLDERSTFNIENGRIVSGEFAEGDDFEYVYLFKFTYSDDGYLASCTTEHKDSYGTYNSKYTYSVSNENITSVDHESTEVYGESIYKYHSEKNIVYDSKLNNLNVDLCLFLLEDELDVWPLTGYYGKRIKNLPLTISKKSTSEDTYNSETKTETSAKVYNFTYTYDGDYPTKIVREKVGSYTITYEIFYNE